jgi:hypothetical protein
MDFCFKNMKSISRFFGIIILIAIQSCKKTEEVSPIPFIELEYIQVNNNGFVDTSASVKIFYRDGDGDLGSLNDNTAQKENVFVRAYEKKNGVFSFLIDQNATMPNLTPTASNKTIEGEIEYLLQLPLQVNNDTLYYEVYIQDRAGHKSNVLKTKEVVVTTF